MEYTDKMEWKTVPSRMATAIVFWTILGVNLFFAFFYTKLYDEFVENMFPYSDIVLAFSGITLFSAIGAFIFMAHSQKYVKV